MRGTLLALLCLATATTDAGILSEWNLLVATDVTTTSHVDGSAKIGGNLTANGGIVSMHGVTAPGNTGLAVGGNISAGNLQINNGGNVRLQGSRTGTVILNGGGTTIVDPTVKAGVTAAFAYLDSLSLMFSEMVSNGTLDNGGNLNAVPTLLDGQMVAIYDLSTTDFTGKGQLNLNLGTAQTVILNVTSPTGIVNLQAPPNLIGGFSQNNSSRILWNFPNATEITVNNTFNGALLAPHADLIALGGGLNGTVAVHSLSNHNAEIRRFNYTGYVPPVPEPSSYVLAGMAALAMIPWACRVSFRRMKRHETQSKDSPVNGTSAPVFPASPRMRDRRCLRAGCRRSRPRRPAGVPTGAANHSRPSGRAYRTGALPRDPLVQALSPPRRRGRRRHARLGEQRVFSGRFSSGSRSSTAMCRAIFRVLSTFSDTAPGRHSRLNGSP